MHVYEGVTSLEGTMERKRRVWCVSEVLWCKKGVGHCLCRLTFPWCGILEFFLSRVPPENSSDLEYVQWG